MFLTLSTADHVLFYGYFFARRISSCVCACVLFVLTVCDVVFGFRYFSFLFAVWFTHTRRVVSRGSRGQSSLLRVLFARAPVLGLCFFVSELTVTETPLVSLRLPSGSFSDPQMGASERQARRLLPAPACVCVPLDAAVTLWRLLCISPFHSVIHAYAAGSEPWAKLSSFSSSLTPFSTADHTFGLTQRWAWLGLTPNPNLRYAG